MHTSLFCIVILKESCAFYVFDDFTLPVFIPQRILIPILIISFILSYVQYDTDKVQMLGNQAQPTVSIDFLLTNL